MAYKFQSGSATLDGSLSVDALTGSTTLTVSGLRVIDSVHALSGSSWEVGNGTAACTVGGALTLASISASSTLTAVGAIQFGAGDSGTTTISAAGAYQGVSLSASAGLSAFGTITLDGATDTAFDTADSVYYRDSDGTMKRDSWDDIMDATAGAGITNTLGVLSVAGGGTTPNGISDEAANLLAGFNYGNATFTANRIWTLPASPSSGDIVRVKTPADLGAYNLTITGSGGQTIDGMAPSLDVQQVGAVVSLIALSTGITTSWALF